MGILNESVNIRVCSKTWKYYNDKGYKIPRKENGRINKDSYISVRVDDLQPKTHIKVDVECDNCHIHKQIEYRDYIKSLRDGNYYCCGCIHTLFFSGENNPVWNFSLTDNDRINGRTTVEYDIFKKSVLARDKYTCECYGIHSENLEVHHLDSHNWCKEKRTDITNGITLCHNCHYNFHSQYGFGNNTKKQFEEWLGYSVGKLENYNNILPTAKKVYDYSEHKIYKSAIEWARIHKVTKSQVYDCCNKKTTKNY